MTKTGDDTSGLKRMRGRWEALAKEDPRWSIVIREDSRDPEQFLAGGRWEARRILEWTGPDLQRDRMLEIGCGVGRMLAGFAPHFGRVDGIDISPEMIARGREADHSDNVFLTVGSGADLAPFDDHSVDFVVSFLVFQHIPAQEVIGSYLEEISRVLTPSGKAVLQFDTRPYRPGERLLFKLPDPLLPRARRRFIRRYRLPPERPAQLAEKAGLTIAEQRDRGTEMHLVLAEPARPE